MLSLWFSNEYREDLSADKKNRDLLLVEITVS